MEERAVEYGGQLNLDGELDWGDPVGEKNGDMTESKTHILHRLMIVM